MQSSIKRDAGNAAAVIVTTILVPLLTAWVAHRAGLPVAGAAGGRRRR